MSREQIIEHALKNHTRPILDVEKQRVVFIDPTATAVGRALRAAAAKA